MHICAMKYTPKTAYAGKALCGFCTSAKWTYPRSILSALFARNCSDEISCGSNRKQPVLWLHSNTRCRICAEQTIIYTTIIFPITHFTRTRLPLANFSVFSGAQSKMQRILPQTLCSVVCCVLCWAHGASKMHDLIEILSAGQTSCTLICARLSS